MLSNGVFNPIVFPGAALTDVEGINGRGDIVGFYEDSSGNSHGLLLHKGVFTTIDVPGVAQTFGLFGINGRGDMVGVTVDDDGNDHGFLLRHGEFTTVDAPGSIYTDANGINDRGDIVGLFIDGDGNGHGYVLRSIITAVRR
jgi:uncharacterized membrane protein